MAQAYQPPAVTAIESRFSSFPRAGPAARLVLYVRQFYTSTSRTSNPENGREPIVPIYEYRCRSCDREFEELIRSADDEPRLVCPSCKGKRVERKLSVFAAARDQASSMASELPTPPCGRCGDARGSCSM
jgi:putative FmdB family regulatory protein